MLDPRTFKLTLHLPVVSRLRAMVSSAMTQIVDPVFSCHTYRLRVELSEDQMRTRFASLVP